MEILHTTMQALGFPCSADCMENCLLLFGGIVVGIIIASVIFNLITKRTYIDKRMPAVKVMRIRRGEKKIYVANPRDMGEFLHTAFIILLWESGLKRGANSIYYSNGGTSAAVKWFGFAFTFLFFALLIYLSVSGVLESLDMMDNYYEPPYM
jgi:hypothetical protein